MAVWVAFYDPMCRVFEGPDRRVTAESRWRFTAVEIKRRLRSEGYGVRIMWLMWLERGELTLQGLLPSAAS